MKRYPTLAIVLSLPLLAGCPVIDGMIDVIFDVPGSQCIFDYEMSERRKNDLLTDAEFGGIIDVGNVQVSYEEGLEQQANWIADQTKQVLSDLDNSTGFQMTYDYLEIYLRRDDMVRDPITGRGNPFFQASDTSYGVVLYVEPERESCESILASNNVYPFGFIHEVVEGSLICPRQGAKMPSDWSWDPFGFPLYTRRYYTRWFRDGFANYAGMLADEAIIWGMDFSETSIPPEGIQPFGIHQPFSTLQKVGQKLFVWDQFTNPRPEHTEITIDTYSPESIVVTDYYDAGMGLFMIIEDRYGQDTIKQIILGIRELAIADGPALINLVNETINTDVVALVEEFRFPYTGMVTTDFYPSEEDRNIFGIEKAGLYVILIIPGGAADNAGIKESDVIYAINGRETLTNLHFEWVLYDLMDQSSVSLSLWRKDVGDMTVELTL